jgi:hypothetical protein
MALGRVRETMTLPNGERPSDKAAEIVIEAAEHGSGRGAKSAFAAWLRWTDP